jgi:hypothetical protein
VSDVRGVLSLVGSAVHAGPTDHSTDLSAASVIRCGHRERVFLMGHSFGAATVALAAQRINQRMPHHDGESGGEHDVSGGEGGSEIDGGCGGNGESSLVDSKARPVKAVVLWDPWAFALPDTTLDDLTMGAPCFSAVSEAWVTGDELPHVTATTHNERESER